MLNHENPNIKIINKNLWAVRFSLIPYIPQISYKPDPSVASNDEPCQYGADGIMLLNKDLKFFVKFRNVYSAVMKRNGSDTVDQRRNSCPDTMIPKKNLFNEVHK